MVQHTNGVVPPDAGSLSQSLSSPEEDDDAFPRPRPRPPPQRSPSQAAKVRVQNRRRAFLEREETHHHAYFASPEHELADPNRYDALVRRFQAPAEREAEGRARGGWGKTLEVSLLRGEARLGRLAASSSSPTGDRKEEATTTTRTNDDNNNNNNNNFAIDAADLVLAEDEEEEPQTKEEGRRRWEAFLRERFVRGGDDDFDYAAVDGDEALDRMEDRDHEEAWFDEEAPEWADDSSSDDDEDNNGGGGTAGSKKRERVLQGETGIQDY